MKTPQQRAHLSSKLKSHWQAKASHPVAVARTELRLSQRSLSQLSGVSLKTIGTVEAGRTAAEATRRKLARTLAKSEKDLFS
jgi:DNA-binding XRE family transcriptional regulator